VTAEPGAARVRRAMSPGRTDGAAGNLDIAQRPDLLALERGTGLVLGLDGREVLPAPSGRSPRVVLEATIEKALQRSPCVVSFSGGRDSSAVLAVAASVARRHGLPLPVPVSLVFPDSRSADAHEWQELVVRHLELPDWQRIVLTDEMDIVGPIAAPVLFRHGTMSPFNAFFHVPIFERAAGGSVLSGAFGDEIMTADWAWHRENQVAQRRARLLPMDVARMAVASSPSWSRSAFLRIRDRAKASPLRRPGWLRESAFETVLRTRKQLRARESLSFDRSVRNVLWPLRSRALGYQSMRTLAADHDVHYEAPFSTGDFVAAVCAQQSWRMPATRAAALADLAGDVLPVRLPTRTDKAWFDTSFFNRHARAFAREWDGSGVDHDYVDADQLRENWLTADEPDARTYVLLQQAWLTAQGLADQRLAGRDG
jgi:hypothetical protein